MSEVKGWHVATVFVAAFSVIIAVNLSLAFNAIRTFPGLEVKNSYVASQSFDADRRAQEALGWEVEAYLEGAELVLSIQKGDAAVSPKILAAVMGRATTVAQDVHPAFVFDGSVHRAPIARGSGNWNLRLTAEAADGTIFKQRIIVKVGQ